MDRFVKPSCAPAAWLCAAALALPAAALSACDHKAAQEDAVVSADVPTIKAEIGTVVRQNLIEPLTVRGSVMAMPNQDVRIAAIVAGRIESLPVAEGDAVKAGQIVAQIDARPLADQRRQAVAAVDQAKAALENARLNLTRTESLFQKGVAAGKEVEDARALRLTTEAALEQANAALDLADQQLTRANVRSPIDGVVVHRLVAVGEHVDGTSAQPVVEVANLGQVEVAANIPADHLGEVRVGQPAAITSDAYGDRTFTGQVMAIAPAVDPATNTVLARIRVGNAGGLLKVGLFAQVRITLGERRNVLTVPPSAISRGDDDVAVYVVEKDTATRTKVTLGLETPDAVEILSGVTEGRKVLLSGIHGLGEKAKLAGSK